MYDLELDQLLLADGGGILDEDLLDISIDLVVGRPACGYHVGLLSEVGIIFDLDEEASLVPDGVGRYMINGLNEVVLDHAPLKLGGSASGQLLRQERPQDLGVAIFALLRVVPQFIEVAANLGPVLVLKQH